MERFIYVAHKIANVVRHTNISVFNPADFEHKQLTETINNIESHCFGMLTRYIIVKDPETTSNWHAVRSELYNQVYNELSRARVALRTNGTSMSVDAIDGLRFVIEGITDSALKNS